MSIYQKIKATLSVEKISFYMIIILPTLASLLINALLGKVIAIYLDPSSFGIYSLQFVVFSLVNSIFFGPLINTYKTFREVIDTSYSMQYFDSVISLMALFSAAGLFIVSLWFSTVFNPVMAMMLSALLLVQGLFSIRLARLQLVSDFKGHGWFSLLSAFLNLVILWMLTALFKLQNHLSIWIAILTASFISLLAIWQKTGIVKICMPWKSNISAELTRKMKWFIWPLMLVAFMNSINNYADRYIIQLFMSTYDVGIYSAGYGLGSKVLFLMTPILVYLSPIVYNNVKSNPFIVFRTINRVLVFHTLLGLLACAGLFILRDFIGLIFLSEQYKDAFILIPWVGIGFVFYNAVFAIETYFYASGRSKIILYHNLLGAICNIGANLLFIPLLGLKGAALASLMSFFIQFLYCYILLTNSFSKSMHNNVHE